MADSNLHWNSDIGGGTTATRNGVNNNESGRARKEPIDEEVRIQF